MELTEQSKVSLRVLTEWWEDAGVPVDTRELERMLRAARQAVPTSEKSEQSASTAPVRARSSAPASSKLVQGIHSLDALKTAVEAFEGCDLKQHANNTVFADGAPSAQVMVIGEGPGREEDREGLPFVGPAGHLLDKMLASIGLSRQQNAYIANVIFWRPPGNRNPTPEELAICRPFVDKHIELIAPKLIIATGLVPANALLSLDANISNIRGKKFNLDVPGLKAPVPVFPIFHPSFLLRRPAEKARAWEDLLTIKAFMEAHGI